jgi:acyl-CoA synthetase (NDP forming)
VHRWRHFFNPGSVAVIGASNSPFTLGATICRALNEISSWDGAVFAVNRKAETVHGCPGYAAVTDIPETVDLAVIITPARVVPQFVQQCADKGIRHVIIESSGFSESGEEGKSMQRMIDETARKSGMRIMGPNCLGVLNTRNQFCCFYGIQADDFNTFAQESGNVSYIIQSGGIVVIVLESFTTDVVRANKIVSIGNKSDIDEADMLEYFSRDDSTEVIGMYLENIKDGRKFIEAARRVTKPILAFKVGRTSEGARRPFAHAGMGDNDRISRGLRSGGIIRVNSSPSSTPCKMFTHMPPLRGKRIAVFITRAPSAALPQTLCRRPRDGSLSR